MIDPKLLRTDPDALRAAQEARGESSELVDQLIAADEQRRSSIAAFENLRAEQKTIGKDVARAKGDDKVALIRMIVSDDSARVASVLKNMIKPS